MNFFRDILYYVFISKVLTDHNQIWSELILTYVMNLKLLLRNQLISLTLSSTFKNQNTAKISEFGKAGKCLEEKEMVRYFWHRGPWTEKNRDPFVTVEKRTGNQLTSFKMDRNSSVFFVQRSIILETEKKSTKKSFKVFSTHKFNRYFFLYNERWRKHGFLNNSLP